MDVPDDSVRDSTGAIETDAIETDAIETDAIETDAIEADAIEADAAEADAAEAVRTVLLGRLDELAALMTTRIQHNVDTYSEDGIVAADELLRTCRTRARFVLSALGATVPDEALGRATGRRGAEQGIPLPDVMSAYRLGLTVLWEEIADVAVSQGVSPMTIVALTSRVWAVHEYFVRDIVSEYREAAAQRALAEEEEASALVASLLEGRINDRHTLVEVANLLRIPSDGPFVAVVAEVQVPGQHALPGVREKLAAHDLPSAWRLLPDAQVGIVRAKDDKALDRLAARLRRLGQHRIGISPTYTDLGETVAAVRLARLVMLSCTDEEPLGIFEQNLLAVVSVTEPEVMGRLAASVLAGLAEVPEADRDVLLATLRAWAASGGSAAAASGVLHCHPNTVRYRLRRIEERTGLSTAHPRDITMLCLAAEVDLRLRDLLPGQGA